MDARRTQLKALLRADTRPAKALGVIEAGVVDAPESPARRADPVSTSVIISRAYVEQVEQSNLRIQSSSESRTSPIPKVRRAV